MTSIAKGTGKILSILFNTTDHTKQQTARETKIYLRKYMQNLRLQHILIMLNHRKVF
jgi:two-component SAPR family response regulator